MKIQQKVILIGVILVLIPSLIWAQGQKEFVRLGIPTGSAEGLAYGVVMGLCTIVNRELSGEVQMTTEVSPGTVVNLEYMRQKKALVALSDTGGLYEAINSLANYAGKPPLTGVSNLIVMYARETSIITPKDRPLKSLADLKGKRVHIGQAGSPTPIFTKRWLEGLKLWEDIKPITASWADGADGLKSGNIDACVGVFPSYPLIGFAQVFQTFPVDWYSMSKEEVESSLKIFPYVVEVIVKPGPTMYKGVDHDVRSFASSMGLMAQNELSEDIVYKIAKTIMKSPNEVKVISPGLDYMLVTENQAAVSKFVPIHKGMQKYLKEKGVLK